MQQNLHQISTPAIQRKKQFFSYISNNMLSYVLMMFSACFWVSGYIYGNQTKMSPFETGILRSFMIVLINYFICRYKGYSLCFDDNKPSHNKLIVRSVLLIMNGVVFAGIQFYLPVPIVHTIGCTGPLFIFLIQYFVSDMRINKNQIIGVTISFIGILFVANGRQINSWLDSSYEFHSDFTNYATHSTSGYIIATLILILNAVLWAVAIFLTKQVVSNGIQTAFHFGVVNLLACSILYIAQQVKLTSEVMYLGLFWTGLPLGISQTIFTVSLAISDNVGITTIVGFTTVIIGYIMSLIRYNETINLICMMGTLFVIGGVIRVTYKQKQDSKQQN